ncbi:TonB-dependent receptor [Chitinophaga varians]|uniref:TonB-dependent receptor n=1 Tax=Chitinophaga varians TaxID=2202339 RepID=UPI00165EDA60|nr:TonB-dependent receptor [Chitinophaga varians]MBC9914426.1 TonB-dependent receptor [Chitinophaga varians]
MIKGVSAPLRRRKTGLQLLLLILIILAGNITVTAQTGLLGKRFTCHEIHGTIPFLLEKVSTYSGTVIEYASGYLDGKGDTRLREGTTTVGAVLNELLAGKYVKIEERNGKVMLVPSATVLAGDSLVNEYTLFGYITEENSLEPIPYAMIKDEESGRIGQSNRFGYYSLRLKSGVHHIRVIHAGYPPVVSVVPVNSNIRRNLMMRAAVLREVKVTPGCMLQKDGGSSVDKYLPSAYSNFLGESDPVRSLYLLPGNIESQETTGKLMVRGGDPEQNIFLLDGNEVFNPTHMLGELSIVSEGTLKSIRQFKNDFPGRFDGALSSVTEVNTKDGSMDTWSGQINAGLLAGAIAVDGPLIKKRTAIVASVRKSWSDPLLNVLDSNYRLRFYDVHFKVTHLLDVNNKIMLSGYMGKDRLELTENDYQNLQVWGNRLATLNWNHVIGARSFVNTTLNISNYHNLAGMKLIQYDDSTGEEKDTKAYNNYASVERYEARTQFEINASSKLQYRFGGKFLHTVIHPFGTNITSKLGEVPDGFRPMKPLPFTEYSFYYENEFKLSQRFLLRPGLLFSAYQFKSFHYHSLQPRLFAAYRIGKNQQLTFSYARMAQYLHQVTSPFLGINSVLWVPSTAILRPAESDMFNLGYSFNDNKGTLLSADVYYRKMNNVTNFAERGNIFYNEDTWEQDIITGQGWGYGAELLAGKRWRKWQLQLSYTLAWAWRQFDDVNDGEKFPFLFDRRHQLNIAANFRPDKHWDIGAVWYFSSGDWMRRPMGTLPAEEGEPFRYEGMSYYDKRGPNYQRLNCNVNYRFVTGRLKHKISTGVYNAYHADGQYSTDILNTRDNNNVTLSGNRLFDLTYYLSYTLNF